MEYFFKCPKCGNLSSTVFMPIIGQHLLCPYCNVKYNFLIKYLVGHRSNLGPVESYSQAEIRALAGKCVIRSRTPNRKRISSVAKSPQRTSLTSCAREVVRPDVENVSASADVQVSNVKLLPDVPPPSPAVEPTVKAEAEPAVEAKAEPAVEAKAEPTVKVEAEPAVEVEAEPTVKAEAEPPPPPAVEPTLVVKAEPTVKVEAEPAVEAKAEPDVGKASTSEVAQTTDAKLLQDESPQLLVGRCKCQESRNVSVLNTGKVEPTSLSPKEGFSELLVPSVEVRPVCPDCLTSRLPAGELITHEDIFPRMSDIVLDESNLLQNSNDVELHVQNEEFLPNSEVKWHGEDV